MSSSRSPRQPRRTAAGPSERGSASIQMVLLLPVLFTVMFLGMQAALFYHARSVAIAAAQEGARASSVEEGSGGAGAEAAASFVAAAGGDDVLKSARVSSSRTAEVATVVVTGTSLSVIPGWSPVVRQSATVPLERITR
ncbi:TadE/TadG family type IV pilus assembly protein [Terrabacter sp. Ter38]|uniref:TadE/TadG family type IV pilus assembly protein n=1 Tax=Terrabacter sp. Ter38 TaxID=2926030 RepID=UPI00211948E3|nr:TadE family protein [Terrabacter sp. Ter38]